MASTDDWNIARSCNLLAASPKKENIPNNTKFTFEFQGAHTPPMLMPMWCWWGCDVGFIAVADDDAAPDVIVAAAAAPLLLLPPMLPPAA